MNRNLVYIAGTLLIISLGAACYLTGISTAAAVGEEEDIDEILGRLQDVSKAFVAVARKVKPAVVYISSTRTVEARGRWGLGEYERTGTGSGVIVDAKGIVVTNNHVVARAKEVRVKLSDHRVFKAKVLGTDSKSDIAVLQIQGEDLPACALGDSDALEVGQWVLAIGNPFGLEQTVTAGIVSAKGRANLNLLDYEDFIQTDAAINPGNSGGPLVNLKGEVIGINAAILSRTGGYQGIGFAIPIKMVGTVVDQVVAYGRVSRGFLGIRTESVELLSDAVKAVGIEDPRGALVKLVSDGSPADKAGIKRDDVILKIGDRRVTGDVALRTAIGQHRPGSEVEVVVFRRGSLKTLTATLDDLDATLAPLGIEVRELTPSLARRYGYDARSGVLVWTVDHRGLANFLERGDLILEIGGRDVTTLEEVGEALKDAGRSVILKIQREDRVDEVVVNR